MMLYMSSVNNFKYAFTFVEFVISIAILVIQCSFSNNINTKSDMMLQTVNKASFNASQDISDVLSTIIINSKTANTQTITYIAFIISALIVQVYNDVIHNKRLDDLEQMSKNNIKTPMIENVV